MPTCPNGHQSGSDDWCEVCGHRMAGAVPPPPPPPPPAGGGYGFPPPPPGAGGRPDNRHLSAVPNAEPELCPQCRTPREGGAPFCEECRWNFLTNTATSYTPAAPRTPGPGAPGPGGPGGPGAGPDARFQPPPPSFGGGDSFEYQGSRPSQVNRPAEPIPSFGDPSRPPGQGQGQGQGPGQGGGRPFGQQQGGQGGPGGRPPFGGPPGGPQGPGGTAGGGSPAGSYGRDLSGAPGDLFGQRGPGPTNPSADPFAREPSGPGGQGGQGGPGGQGGYGPDPSRQDPRPGGGHGLPGGPGGPGGHGGPGGPGGHRAPQAFQQPGQPGPQAPPGYPQETGRPQQPSGPSFGGGDDDWVLSPPSHTGGPGGNQGGGYGYPQPGGNQAPPPPGPAFPQQPATWTATIGPDREYFMSMMHRSGPEAAGLNLPAYSPEQQRTLGGNQITIGRRRHSTGETPDIDLSVPPEDPGVSHQHAVLVQQPDGSWAVVDQNSTNGTTVNGSDEPIQPFVPVPLQDGDRVHVGAWTTITVRRG